MKILLFLAAVLILLPQQTLANFCACCAEKGQYTVRVKKPDDYEIGELKRLQIDDTTLFTDAGYPDTIKGISPLTENYTAGFMWQPAGWKFDFRNEKNATGGLNLIKAPTMVDFRTDLYEGEGDPLLYKELRFKYKVLSGTGIFSKGIAPATEYLLVFQGRGNNCMNAEDFKHWRLEITGKKAMYAFFGKLKVKD